MPTGRVEPASPIELTTFWTEALRARRSCASSLETFTQYFLHRAWLKTRGPESGSRSALIVVDDAETAIQEGVYAFSSNMAGTL